jgi:hypothetical protein
VLLTVAKKGSLKVSGQGIELIKNRKNQKIDIVFFHIITLICTNL